MWGVGTLRLRTPHGALKM